VKRRGRPRVGKIRTVRISDTDYTGFVLFCKSIGKTPSEVLRSLITEFYVKGMLSDLKLEKLIRELKKE